MIALGYYLLKVFICSAVLFLYYHIALRNKIFHQWNRFYLLAIVVLSLILPTLQIHIGAADESNKAIHLLRVVSAADEYVVDASSRSGILSTTQWMGILYTTICGWLAVLFLFSLTKIYSIIRSGYSRPLHNIRLIDSEAKGTPFSFLHFIIWNKKIDLHSEAGQLVFKHELVHVQEKHTLDKLFLQTVLIFFWCNPVFWFIRKELGMIHEFIADQKAVEQQGTEAFAAMILQAAYPQQYSTLTHSFFQSPIKRRLAMLTKMQNPKISYFSRILALPLLAFIGLAFTLKTETQPQDRISNNIISNTNPQKEHIAIENVQLGNIQELAHNDTLPSQTYHGKKIKNLVVKKSQQVVITYADGTQETLSVQEAKKQKLMLPPPPPITPAPGKSGDGNSISSNALIVVDGVEKGRMKELGNLDALVKPNEIESVNVLKGESATKRYGEKGKSGVIEIIMKKSGAADDKVIDDRVIKPGENKTFTQVEKEAHFPGGDGGWRSYLQKNLNASTPIDHGAPEGEYKVILQFIVHTDGTLSDIKPLTHKGYGMEEEVVKLIKNGPKWVPAEQNGHAVASIKKQTVTFVVAAQ